MKTAIVYDRVNKWGGAERTLLALHEIYPEADLFTSVYSSQNAVWAKVFPRIKTSFLQKVPFAETNHELLGTFTPLAFETLDLMDYDLIISVTSEAAKGVITKPSAVHVCYCLTPTRYLWSAHDLYFKNPPGKLGLIPFFWQLSRPPIKYLQRWDKIAAQRPDYMIAISTEVQKRIRKYYGRESALIFPPVNTSLIYSNEVSKRGDFFLVVSRLVPYKRVELAVSAFNALRLSLVVVGTGSQERMLKSRARNNIKFVGELGDRELANYYQKARALIFPQIEDFGIVSLEAQAAGTPVIAYRAGGALDTVIEGKTGIFFDKQDKRSLIAAVKRFEKMTFNKSDLIHNAAKFSKENFQKRFAAFVSRATTGRIN